MVSSCIDLEGVEGRVDVGVRWELGKGLGVGRIDVGCYSDTRVCLPRKQCLLIIESDSVGLYLKSIFVLMLLILKSVLSW